MGSKIRVQDLAKMMNIGHQDLVFKLRSIGVRVEGDDAQIDSDIIQAILQGKKLPQPREVILRDESEQPQQPAQQQPSPRTGPASPTAARRMVPGNPLRPNRPRTLIQTVEPRIRTIEVPERPFESALPLTAAATSTAPETAEAATAEVAPAPTTPVVETPQHVAPPPPPAPAMPPQPAAPAPPRRGATLISRGPGPVPPGSGSAPRPSGTGPRPSGPSGPMRPSGPSGPMRPSGPSGPMRPSGPPQRTGPAPTRPGTPPGRNPMPSQPMRRPGSPGGMRPGGMSEAEKERERKAKRGVKRPTGLDIGADDVRGLRSLEEVENVAYGVQEGPETASSARRRRRVERELSVEPGKVLSFKKDKMPITVSEGMTVREFAEKLGVKTRELTAHLIKRGFMANINDILDPDQAVKIATDLGFEAMKVSFEEETQLRHEEAVPAKVDGRSSRGPVVTIMGHVDHGKTSLLDVIRSSKVTESEFGGITQHIGAYQVEVNNRKIVFLDTPGHEAFTLMRARGARVTDIVILVVAADDGVMPQTIEAINHARAAKVALIVAINKIDKPNANVDRVKKELADHGVLLEDWGGETVGVQISALKKQGITQLLEMIVLTADLLDLKANLELPAQGVVLEARKDVGRGIVATVLVQDGTLKAGDSFAAGATWGRVRSMADDDGKRLKEAGPATPIEITGFTEVPAAGDLFQVVAEEERARSIAEFRSQENRRRDLNPNQGKLSLEQLFTQIQKGDVKELPVVVKGDVQGSVEVISDTVVKLSTEKVKVVLLHSGVGAISTNDVLLASASKAIVVGFNVRPERNATELAEQEKVEIRLYTVIYELMDDLRKAMTGLLSPTYKEVQRGRAEVRDTFKVPKIGTIAGCHVVEGVIPRSAGVRLLRDNRVIFEGKIASLRRFKDDASEVRAGFDCGIGLERFQDLKPGDMIEAFAREEVAPTL